MATIMSDLVGHGKSKNFVKNNQLKIFGDGSLAVILLTVVASAGLVDGQFHMTNIAQNPLPGEQVIGDGDVDGVGDVEGGRYGGGGGESLVMVMVVVMVVMMVMVMLAMMIT